MDIDKDIKLAIGWNRLNLKLVGVWPEPTAPEDRSSRYRFLVSTTFILVFITAPQSINLFLLEGNLEMITENLCLANIPVITAALKVLVARYYREELKPLIKSIYDDWYDMKTEEERVTMLNSAKMSRQISTWCSVLIQVMVTCYLGLRIARVATCDRNKESQDRLVLYPGYFPYNVRPTWILVLTNMAQVIAAYCATCSYTSVDAFIAMLVLHMCGQFQNLMRRLERLMDQKGGTKSKGEIQDELVWIIKRHEHLNWMANEVDNSFNILMLIQMVLCTVQICFQGFMFFSVILHSEEGLLNFNFLFFILFVLFVIVHIYLYCYVGEMLLVHSNEISNSAYNSNWFNVSPEKAKCLLFIMNRCSRPLCLSAGKFRIFSMELFSAILKTAMSYLSVLLTVSSDE